LIGKDEESEELLTRAHNEFLSAGQLQRAARAAFWLGFSLFSRGAMSRGGGWLSRARRLLDESASDCVERGFLLVPQAVQTVHSDPAGAHAAFSEAAAIGARFRDPDLLALGRIGQGESMILLGDLSGGVALLDEVMVGVAAGEVLPIVTGLVYCAVIETCHGIFDLRRAHEWTTALSGWCSANPDIVPFRGQCQIRRAEIMRLHGDWDDAIGELVRARDRLSARGERAVSAAYYQLGELHRARGEFAEAEELYRRTAEYGRTPQPGLAQLRLAQGRRDAAQGAIRSALQEAAELKQRLRLLPAYVEIMLAVDDVAAAQPPTN
ncbi:MAG: tetratricopeptide repeat protein, partial [Gemmatimonadaceae bacterium]